MNPMEPIAGLTLEKYAELCAAMRDAGGDPDKNADIAARHGVSRQAWEAAQQGWTARMSSPATAATVAVAFMPLYQAALARTGPVATATFDEYVVMTAMINSGDKSLDRMYAHFGIDAVKWSQVSTHWVGALTRDPQLGARFGDLVKAEMQRLQAGHPPSLAARGAAGSVVNGIAVNPQAAAAPQAPAGPSVGARVLVQWSDGNRYPGQVAQAGDGQYLIAFGNGQQHWVPLPYLSPA